MSTSSCTTNLFLLSLLYSTNAFPKSARFTPLNTFDSGATLEYSPTDVAALADNTWSVNTVSQSGWQFIINLDPSWGFHAEHPTSISTTIYGPTGAVNTNEILFGFSTNPQRYFSLSVPMDNMNKPTKLYPGCYGFTTRPFGAGNVATRAVTNRACDIAGGSCNFWQDVEPLKYGELPLTVTLVNDPNNGLSVYLTSAALTTVLTQDCDFEHFPSSQGLNIYFAGAELGGQFQVSSIDVASKLLTEEPTRAPTTAFPTNYPTLSPTGKPSENPTNQPTNSPSQKPTPSPSNNPSFAPTNLPTLATMDPSPSPTNRPSVDPTLAPTYNPSYNPSFSPTKSPSNSPTTAAPSESPTTAQPTKSPTAPAPNGFVYGAHNQFCSISALNTRNFCSSTEHTLSHSVIDCFLPYDCCLCKFIECGVDTPCTSLRFGDYGAFGVQDIAVSGNADIMTSGAIINCVGNFACSETQMTGSYVQEIKCTAIGSCQNAEINLFAIKEGFALDCAGFESCAGLKVHVHLPALYGNQCNPNDVKRLTKISCGGERACEGLQLTINNKACNPVLIENIECATSSSCNLANFNLIGNVGVETCVCGPGLNHCEVATGLSSCFERVRELACSDHRSCAGVTKNIINPLNGFILECSNLESCQNGNFYIEFNQNYKPEPITTVEAFIMGGIDAANHATFTLHNTQNNILTVNRIECNGERSCVGTTFITGYNVEIGEIVCAKNVCRGCTIKLLASDPSGIPCDSSQVILNPNNPILTRPPPPPNNPILTRPPYTPSTTTTSTTTTAIINWPTQQTEILCAEPKKCMNLRRFVTNPANAFMVECSNEQSCQNGNFHIEIDRATRRPEPITFFDSFALGGMEAAKNAVFRIDNQQIERLRLELIECSGFQSCVGTVFHIGYNVEVETIVCAPGACTGCLVKIDETVTFPCDPAQ